MKKLLLRVMLSVVIMLTTVNAGTVFEEYKMKDVAYFIDGNTGTCDRVYESHMVAEIFAMLDDPRAKVKIHRGGALVIEYRGYSYYFFDNQELCNQALSRLK